MKTEDVMRTQFCELSRNRIIYTRRASTKEIFGRKPSRTRESEKKKKVKYFINDVEAEQLEGERHSPLSKFNRI